MFKSLIMGHPVTYRGFWGMRSGETLYQIAEFLSWGKEDWANFERTLDLLEKEKVAGKKRPRRLIRQTLYALRRQGALEQRQRGEQIVIRLTEVAWRAIMIRRLKIIKNACPAGICYVIYDIPERQRVARDTFRRFLRSAGFSLRQQSIWSSPRDVGGIVREMIDELDIGDWVTIIEGQERKSS